MGVSDPVLFPAPGGTAEAVRQDIWRTRMDLREALAELAARVEPRAILRRWSRRIAFGLLGGSALAIATGTWARHVDENGRYRMEAALAAGGGLAVVVLVWRFAAGQRTVSAFGVRHGVAGSRVEASKVALALADHPAPPGGDVVDMLMAQHRRIEEMFARVTEARGVDRLQAFAALVDLLNRHEHAEQAIVHPALKNVDGSSGVVEERMQEESTADRAMGRLISMGVDDRTFDREFRAFADLVRAHAAHEERWEFPRLRAMLSAETLQRIATQVRAAQTEPW